MCDNKNYDKSKNHDSWEKESPGCPCNRSKKKK